MKKLSEIGPVLEAMGSSTRDAANWIDRLDFSTPLAPTVSGKARMFTKANALEIALTAAIVKGGASPSDTVLYVASILRTVKATGKASREWLVFPFGDLQKAKGSNDPCAEKLSAQLGKVPLAMVPIGEVVRLVDALYSEAD